MIYKADLLNRLGSQSGFGHGSGRSPQDQEKFEECLSGHDARALPGMASCIPVAFASPSHLDDRGPRPPKRKRNRLIEATNEMFEHLLAVLSED